MTWLRLPRGTLRRDLAVAGAFFLIGLVLHFTGVNEQMRAGVGVPDAVTLTTLTGMGVAIALRRIATRACFALGTAALGVSLLFGGVPATALIYPEVLYETCVYGSPRMWRGLLRVVVVLAIAAAAIGAAAEGSWQGVTVAGPVILICVLPVVTGISVRQYRDQAAAERAQAEQTARLAELDRRQAVTTERNRMARELHDVIANHLSAIAIHSSALLSMPGLDRAQLDQALRVIRENSVQGLAEVRQMITLLREPVSAEGEGDGASPEGAIRPRLTEIDRLVSRSRDSGLAVRLETTGEPRPLPASVDLAAYRIVQESLTNALKHGTGQAQVHIEYLPEQVRITVENPLPEQADHSVKGSGTGVIGMHERATLLNGRFDAGPHGRCWRVRAELPAMEVTK